MVTKEEKLEKSKYFDIWLTFVLKIA